MICAFCHNQTKHWYAKEFQALRALKRKGLSRHRAKMWWGVLLRSVFRAHRIECRCPENKHYQVLHVPE